MGKPEVLTALRSLASEEAGVVWSYLQDVPDNDSRFEHDLAPAMLLGFWKHEQQKGSGGGGEGGGGSSVNAVFANIHQLPSASEVGSNPKRYKRFKELVHGFQDAEILDHRPHQQHGPPLDILCEPFAQFSDEARTCIPSLGSAKLAGQLVQLLSEVITDEVEGLQAPLLKLLAPFFQDILLELKMAARGTSEADLVGSIRDTFILLLEAKTDSGGNTSGQLERYFLAAVAELAQRRDKTYVYSCVPTMAVEISGAALRVSGLAMIKSKLLFEPLTPWLHLYCSNSQDHMLQLARALHALHAALRRLAGLRQAAAAAVSPSSSFQQLDSVQWPHLMARYYPGAKVSQPWGQQRPIYYVETQDEERLIVKFMQRGWASEGQQRADREVQRQRGMEMERCWGIEVQQMWHRVLAAPEVVDIWEAGPLWVACVMPALTIADGWMPLSAWAPARTADVVQALEASEVSVAASALTAEEWSLLGMETQAVLARGHKEHRPQVGDGQDLPAVSTVHGDARLHNILARRKRDGSPGFEVLFVDFGWAGLAGQSRYPVMVSSTVPWASGVGPNAVMLQNHDVELLTEELRRGGAVAE